MLSTLLGQAKARSFLEAALVHTQRPPAYLFRGPRGVGKTTAALDFARALLCQCKDATPCDSCTKARAGAHPDIQVYRPEGNYFTIGMVKEIQEAARYRPYLGSLKVLILDQIDTCTLEASNALLKTLEDAPAATLFILLQEGDKILSTIESRCVLVPFYHLSTEHIHRLLEAKSPIPLTYEASMALGVLDDGEEYVRRGRLWGLRIEALKYFQAIMSGSLGDAPRLEREMGKDSDQLHRTFLFFQSFIRDIWQVKEGQEVRNRGMEEELSIYAKVHTSTLFYLSNRVSQFLLVVHQTNPEIQLRAFLSAALLVTGHAPVSK